MEDRKEVFPLRIVAARFVDNDEQAGLAELDRIAADSSRLVQNRYLALWLALVATAVSATLMLILGIVWTINEAPGADTLLIVGLACFILTMAVVASWRAFQYGGIKASAPQDAAYANPDEPAARNLERLFALLQRESTLRAFYRTKSGVRRYVDHRYFFGKLRAAHVAREGAIRSALVGPVGFWFGRELFLEADIDKLIADAKAQPSRKGAPKQYDHTNAIIALIEHPQVRALDISKKRGNQREVIELMEEWYRGRRLKVPSQTQLAPYANQILETIAKNRSS
ncbi:hypothetical protein [Sphingopyxis panaciterrulae]|uniref:Uncharacterized protein n=1 Tax=Sphingopyxis panaciterrulae TaxID=462372 RepID=A0A7W9B946_9SPHN|nr:hypothetical protein [Sphingopyxis panaciterrulae]MBB5708533.1 hypothetical protein [Sphingopyxis panaciterrulae]